MVAYYEAESKMDDKLPTTAGLGGSSCITAKATDMGWAPVQNGCSLDAMSAGMRCQCNTPKNAKSAMLITPDASKSELLHHKTAWWTQMCERPLASAFCRMPHKR